MGYWTNRTKVKMAMSGWGIVKQNGSHLCKTRIFRLFEEDVWCVFMKKVKNSFTFSTCHRSVAMLMDIICMCVDVYRKAEIYTSFFRKYQWTQKQNAPILDLGLLKQKETPFPASLTVKEHPTSQLPCLYISAAFISCEKKRSFLTAFSIVFPFSIHLEKNKNKHKHKHNNKNHLGLLRTDVSPTFAPPNSHLESVFRYSTTSPWVYKRSASLDWKKSQDTWHMWIPFSKSHLCHLWMVVETTGCLLSFRKVQVYSS